MLRAAHDPSRPDEVVGVAAMATHGVGRRGLTEYASTVSPDPSMVGEVVKSLDYTPVMGVLARSGVDPETVADWVLSAADGVGSVAKALVDGGVPAPVAVQRAGLVFGPDRAVGAVPGLLRPGQLPVVYEDVGLSLVVPWAGSRPYRSGVSKEWVVRLSDPVWVNRDDQGRFASQRSGGGGEMRYARATDDRERRTVAERGEESQQREADPAEAEREARRARVKAYQARKKRKGAARRQRMSGLQDVVSQRRAADAAASAKRGEADVKGDDRSARLKRLDRLKRVRSSRRSASDIGAQRVSQMFGTPDGGGGGWNDPLPKDLQKPSVKQAVEKASQHVTVWRSDVRVMVPVNHVWEAVRNARGGGPNFDDDYGSPATRFSVAQSLEMSPFGTPGLPANVTMGNRSDKSTSALRSGLMKYNGVWMVPVTLRSAPVFRDDSGDWWVHPLTNIVFDEATGTGLFVKALANMVEPTESVQLSKERGAWSQEFWRRLDDMRYGDAAGAFTTVRAGKRDVLKVDVNNPVLRTQMARGIEKRSEDLVRLLRDAFDVPPERPLFGPDGVFSVVNQRGDMTGAFKAGANVPDGSPGGAAMERFAVRVLFTSGASEFTYVSAEEKEPGHQIMESLIDRGHATLSAPYIREINHDPTSDGDIDIVWNDAVALSDEKLDPRDDPDGYAQALYEHEYEPTSPDQQLGISHRPKAEVQRRVRDLEDSLAGSIEEIHALHLISEEYASSGSRDKPLIADTMAPVEIILEKQAMHDEERAKAAFWEMVRWGVEHARDRGTASNAADSKNWVFGGAEPGWKEELDRMGYRPGALLTDTVNGVDVNDWLRFKLPSSPMASWMDAGEHADFHSDGGRYSTWEAAHQLLVEEVRAGTNPLTKFLQGEEKWDGPLIGK